VANPSAERLKALSVLPGYRLAVTFRDGTGGIVDLSRVRPDPSHGVFSALADPRLFEQARLELGAVTWPNGADLDPSWMYERIAAVDHNTRLVQFSWERAAVRFFLSPLDIRSAFHKWQVTMPVPEFQALMLPVLALAPDVQEHLLADARDVLAKEMDLTAEERNESLSRGRQR
jgi:hypothetical protein